MLSPATHTAEDVIALFGLAPLPQEGGWFRRTHEAVSNDAAGRRAWSMIHALFTADHFSALHRLGADELWIFQAGDPLDLLLLGGDGTAEHVRLGLDVTAGDCSQWFIPGGVWQGARVRDGGRWTLVTCVVVPEFRWNEFTLANRAELQSRYPACARDIERLTRGS